MHYQENELFQGYEIKNWNFTPRLYKILGAAAVFNILFLLTVAQANVFTTRGCESPLVGNICQVIDTIYLGSKLADTNTDFISKDYQKTELEDAEITYIDVTNVNNQPLNYPEGYFALANPESQMMQTPGADFNNGFPPLSSPNFGAFPPNPTLTNPTLTSPNDILAKPQVTPTPNDKAVIGTPDDSPFTIEGTKVENENPVPPPIGSTTARNNRKPFGGRKAGAGNQTKPAKTPEPIKPDENQPPFNPEAVAEFRPNKKPLEDFAAGIVAKREDKTKPLDLTKNFKVRLIGELNKDGKLNPDPKKSRYIIFKPEDQGDQTMVDIGKEAIQAINDSGLFYFLKQVEVEKVDITLIQDDEQIVAVVSSGFQTKEKAGTASSGLNGLLALAPYKVNEPELLELIKAAKVEQQGKNAVLNFKIDKLVAQTMITKKLAEAEAKKRAEEQQNAKPTSTATVNQNQKTAK